MRTFGVAVLWLLAVASAVRSQQINLLDAGSRSQLLADPSLVYESKGVVFTPHAARKHPANPLLKPDRPWEGWYVSIFAGTVLYDDKARQFRMWYTCPGHPDHFDTRGVCYATSDDGLTWTKPPVGTIKAKSGQAHNYLVAADCPSVFVDATEVDPQRRHKMVCYVDDKGYMAMTSPDGFRWTLQSQKPLFPISYVDDVVSAFHDPRSGEFVALPKMMSPVFGRIRRSIYLSTSRDFRHWSRPEPAFFADRRDDLGCLARLERVRPLLSFKDNFNVMRMDIYGAAAYVAESCTIGFPWMFTVSANVPKYGNQEGPIEPQLAVSRDRESWARPFRTPIVPLGKPGEWDSGMILTASQAIDVGDEVWLYYAGMNHTHGAAAAFEANPAASGKVAGAIGLATWKRDRFVSADGGSEEGSLTTVPLRFEGSRLEINAVTRPNGSLRVELLDPAGNPVKGYAKSQPIVGDNLRHRVVFPDSEDVAALAGRPICVRFHLHEAELYAFAFRK